jgi:hypothetical protein
MEILQVVLAVVVGIAALVNLIQICTKGNEHPIASIISLVFNGLLIYALLA